MKVTDKKALERYKKKLEIARQSVSVNPFETNKARKEAIEKAKKDYNYCIQRYFPHYATSETADFHIKYANKVKKNKTYKGLVPWGRALAKSVTNDIILPFWLWINGEPTYLVLIGNNEKRAQQLLEDLRAEFEANPQIIADFGEQYNQGNWEEGFFITKGGFIGQALGMGQSVRGLRVKNKRPTHLVPDDIETKDLLKNPKRMKEMVRWITGDLIPTMDGDIRRYCHVNNRSAKVMMMTILKEMFPNWDWNQVNAYDPVTYEPTWKEKYTYEYFKDIEKEIGRLAAMAEYNNEPHIEGEIFKEEMIQWAKLPRLDSFKIIIGHWDVAYAGTANSDYNAIIPMGLLGKDFFIIDGFCKQCKMRDAVAYMCQFQKLLPPTVIIHWQFEAQFWNEEVERTIQEVEIEHAVYLNIIKKNNPKINKYDRILSLHPYYQNGRIYYNEKLKSHTSTQIGIAQLLGIEPGYKTHDDYPDSQEANIKELEKYISYNGSSKGNIRMGKYEPNHERL